MTTSQKVTPVKVAKLLGTATRAGKGRAVNLLRVRKERFDKARSRYNALRKLGVDTAAMAQTAAAATMTYGAEACGIADTMLQNMRTSTARICVGDAAGKSTDRTLYAVDGSRSTIDPAFAAHVNPIVMWAHAWWSKWVDDKDLRASFDTAKEKISQRNPN